MKKLRSEVIACLKGGEALINVIDDMIMTTYNITEDEMNFIYRYSDNGEHEIFMDGIDGVSNVSTFTQKRMALEIRNKYLDIYNKTI
jgi:hypothetical protein